MKLKFQIDRFKEAVKAVFGYGKETGAMKSRLNTPLVAKGDTFNTSMVAAFARQIRHSIHASYRNNSRGLPVGVGAHQLRAARALEARVATRPDDDESTISEFRIQSADTVLTAFRRNREVRNKNRRPSKLARRVAGGNSKTMDLKSWCAKHQAKLKENRKQGRVPYTRPLAA